MHKQTQWGKLAIVLVCSTIGLTGCWDRTEVNDLAISIAASIDSAPNHKVLYSKQIAIPSRMGGGQSGGGGSSSPSQGPPYVVVSALGVNMKDAMQNIQMKMSRRLFLAHRRLFLIGEPIARQGIKHYLDEMSRNPQTRLRTNVALTHGEAVDYLKIGYPFERTPAEALRQILYGPQANFKLDIKELMVMMSTPGADPFIPIITLQSAAPGGQKSFKANGIAVFKGDRMVGSLTSSEARSVLWLREQMKRATVTVTIPGHQGKISMDLHHVKTHFDTRLRNGHPVMRIEFKPEVDVLENDTDLDLTDRKYISLAEQAFSTSIKKRVENTLDILQHRYHADIVKFGERVHHAFPSQWKSMVNHWDQEFSNMPVTIDVQVKIRRIGMTGPPLSRNEKEVQH